MRAVLERDFLFEVSRPRAVVLRTVLAAVVAASVLLLLHVGTRNHGFDPDRVGLDIFRAGTSALVILLAILTPPIVVGSILAERQQDTLPLVLASPVGPRSFALAKLLSRCAVALAVALAAFPCLALTVLFGGVSGAQVLGLGVLCAALVVEMAAWSLWISSVSRRLATAAVLSFVLPPARWAATGLLVAWIANERTEGAAALREWSMLVLIDTTPFGAFLELMDPGELGDANDAVQAGFPLAAFLANRPWFAYLAVALTAAAVAVVASGRRLASESEPRGDLLARTARGRKWFRGLPGTGNPMAWKERRLLNTAASRPLFYGVLGVLALATLLGTGAMVDEDDMIVLVVGETVLLSLVAAINGAASLGHERTQGGWDLLRASLLSPDDILRGKMAGLLLGVAFLAVIPTLQLVLSLLMGGIHLRTAAAAALTLLVVPGLWGFVGLRVGTGAPRTRTAVVRACAAFAVVFLGIPLAAAILVAVDVDEEALITWMLTASPAISQALALHAVEELTFESGGFFDEPRAQSVAWMLFHAGGMLALRLSLPGALARTMRADRDTG